MACPFKEPAQSAIVLPDKNDSQIKDFIRPEIYSAVMSTPLEWHLANMSFEGDNVARAKTASRELNWKMREQYAKVIHKQGRSLFPVIVALDNELGFEGRGGTYNLMLKDGTHKRICPANTTNYEFYKNLGHIPLAVANFVSPFFATTGSNAWQSGLLNYRQSLQETYNMVAHVPESNMSKKDVERSRNMLRITMEFIDDCVKTGEASYSKYSQFVAEIRPLVLETLDRATYVQTQAVMPALEQWKKELGAEWSNVWVIVTTIYPVGRESPREQYFKRLMDPDKITTHLIVDSNPRTLDDALTLLGRVVYDRAIGPIVFGLDQKKNILLASALSSEVDIAAADTHKHIENYLSKKVTE